MSAKPIASVREPDWLTLTDIDTPPRTLWYRITVLAVGATVILGVVYILLAMTWLSRPFFGAMVSHTMVVNQGQTVGSEVWNGVSAGLLPNDSIVEINGTPLSSSSTDFVSARNGFNNLLMGLAVGDKVEVTIERSAEFGDLKMTGCESSDGQTATCTFGYELQSLPFVDIIAYFAFPFVSGVIVLAIAIAILYYRPDQQNALLGAWVSLSISIFLMGIFDVGTSHLLSPVWLVGTAIAGGLLVTFGMLFPKPLSITYHQPVISFVPLVVSGVVVAIAVYSYFTVEDARNFGLGNTLAGLSLVVGLLGLFALQLFVQRMSATTLTRRDQSNTVVIGTALTLIPALAWLLVRTLANFDNSLAIPISVESTTPFFVLVVLAIGYSILQYRNFDTDRVISQSITYAIMAGMLVVGYFLLITGATFVTQDAVNASNPIIIVVITFLVAVLFIPIRTNLQRRIDQIYFRERRNYQQYVEQFSQKLTSLVEFDEIVGEFQDVIQEAVNPDRLYVFLFQPERDDYATLGEFNTSTDIRFEEESQLVGLLSQLDEPLVLNQGSAWDEALRIDQTRLSILCPHLIIPLAGTDHLNGFVIIGRPKAQRSTFSYEEMRFVNNMISQLGIAIARAQVVDSLEKRVRELNVLSQVGQAVNFVIEFDDLLELISAQTNRLVPAPYFYIALYEERSEQLYFAFMQEDEERYKDKEDVRWDMGTDLYSQVIRSNARVEVDNFTEEMRSRKVSLPFETADLKAWIGLPLIAGTRTLGVMALGRVKYGEEFTSDQAKILDDIAALAATSIDKANLFRETNRRARQLAVLNDISRQLVATELDVEPLLEIITSSATEILTAEAGSLLLRADDNPEQLEFRVVIGGAGEELVGSRLDSGQGIVGQVALSGQHAIENDAAHNPQHHEVDDEFHTYTILAVPLVAKEDVIGVLEVINKIDGTYFVDEDAELLSTFARQAAIAIENARLFEMTDLQLAQRVRELEILEQIDNRLNRTLHLDEVAQITIDAAIENCKAQAGVLGMINLAVSPPVMDIVASVGYGHEEMTLINGKLAWRLDEGIVARVMRTRSADLAADVSIDRDYISGLENAISQITIPMLSGDEINAILVLETNEAPAFTLSDWGFTQRLAEHASIAIANAQLYDELTRANETQSEFMGFAAHELKTPLASIKGYSEVMLSGMTGDVNEQQQNFLDTIRSNATRMDTIITDLRDFAKLKAQQLRIEPAPISFRHVIVETLRPLYQLFDEKNQSVVNNVAEDLPAINGDQIRLIQVCTNLLTNAHKYSPEETAITINAESIRNYVGRKGVRFGNVLKVSIQDEGIGMSEEDIARLFNENYFRSENELAQEQSGTGLGMMITQGIVQGHGGEIWVESTLGEGSTFCFVVPLADEQVQAQPEPETELASD